MSGVVLHIGLPKTGTTTLQKSVFPALPGVAYAGKRIPGYGFATRALGEAIGLDPDLTLRVMQRTPAYSRAMDVKGEKMLRSEFSPDARLSQHLKDVRLMLELGEQAGLPMTLSAPCVEPW